MQKKQEKVVNKRRIFYILLIASILLGGFIYAVLHQSSKQVIESHALIIADVIAQHATASRSIYAKEIVGKLKADGFGPHVNSEAHKGFVPIPAQFLKLVGKAASEKSKNLFQYHPVSKWNIEPSQGLTDDFLIWAWAQLEAQDPVNPSEAINWTPVWRFENNENSPVLRFLYPDPATSMACAKCHNAYENTQKIRQRRRLQGIELGKVWTQHQLLGALSITVPLNNVESIAHRQIQKTTTLLTITISASLLIIAGFTRKNVRQESKLHHLNWESTHDPLTGLLNRRGMQFYSRSLGKTGKPFLLCAIDLDKFKPINDTYGHQAGDQILQAIASALSEVTRNNDYVIRLGGDEFLVILFNADISKAEQKGEKLLNAIRSAQVLVDKTVITLSASIGIVQISSVEKDFSKNLERADKASYEAKKRGRNQVFIMNN